MPQPRLSARLPVRGLPRQALITILLLIVIILISALVALSPLALSLLDGQAADWERLSFIGQTYGAASAILSVLALIGVSVSLLLQAREAKATREQALRMLHADLMKMAMEDPLYRRAWGPFFESDDNDGPREHMYVNLIVSQWAMEYELRTITEEHLRSIANVLLSGPAGRRYWHTVRELRITSTSTRRERRLHEILDEEYRRTEARSVPAQALPRSPRPHKPLASSWKWNGTMRLYAAIRHGSGSVNALGLRCTECKLQRGCHHRTRVNSGTENSMHKSMPATPFR
ncbi:DUF6082 family protein [Sphaerisporangium viridialbum]|uniref:DUF6082 family protein n=1 Tax=Sphaerisporangium viridialbum TaxID=46189 RepID=UPI003C73ABB9